MKKLMYIFLILPLIMSGCKGKKKPKEEGCPLRKSVWHIHSYKTLP